MTSAKEEDIRAQEAEKISSNSPSTLRSAADRKSSETLDMQATGSPASSSRTVDLALEEDIMEMQPEDFVVNWRKLDYEIKSQWYHLAENRKSILDGLSGTFQSGHLTAILGPSGAGKSSLIDCLLGKKSKNCVSGKVKVTFGSQTVEEDRRKRRPLRIALIPQKDHLLDSFTVNETLMFASKIKNAHLTYDSTTQGKARTPFDHKANVQRVLKQLNLTSCASQKCSELSGGQYKRVSIGQELLSRPDIMILDEPTSGLDSVTCHQTIKALRDLIDSTPYPMAIVATIHQPDIEVFKLFHNSYVIASGGHDIYQGPPDGILDAVRLSLDYVDLRATQWPLANTNSGFLEDIAIVRRQLDDPWCNPAKLIVEIAANEYGMQVTSAMKTLHQNRSSDAQFQSFSGLSSPSEKNSFNASSQSLITSNSVSSLPCFDYKQNHPSNRRADLDKLLNLNSANMNQRRSLWTHMKHVAYHTHRSWFSILRDPMLFSIMLALHLLVPLLISYSFYSTYKGDACPKVGPLDVLDEAYRDGNVLEELNKEIRSAFENLGYMFFQIYVIIFAAVCVTSLTYPMVMHVLLKEYRNGSYSLMSYFLGRTLADLPVPTVNVVIAMAISYHLTGQPSSTYSWRFISVASLTVLATLVAQTMGLMFGAMLMNAPQSAVFVAPASTAPLVVVSGFLLRIKSLPWILQILSQFSYFTHLLNGFIISRYGFGRCPCDESMFSSEGIPQIPNQSKAVINLWVDSYATEYSAGSSDNRTAPRVDLVEKLVDTISLAKTFGYRIENCTQMKPFSMLDYELDDSDLWICYVALISMLIVFRWLTYTVLRWKINTSL